MSKTLTFFEGAWHEGNVRIMGPRTHGSWLGSTVFDGARRFEGVMPDLELHCARVNQSAIKLMLKPKVALQTWLDLVADGVARFEPNAELYIRPMYWACDGAAGGGVRFDPESTEWCLCIYEAPMPKRAGFSMTLSPFRRPTIDCMPVDAKAGCLYPNNSRALFEAYGARLRQLCAAGCVGECRRACQRQHHDRQGRDLSTPVPNGTFLNGITRQRVIGLLRDDGVPVIEKTISWSEVEDADEVFSVGNYSKVAAAIRINERSLQPGPMFRKARELYWEFARAG